MHPSADFLTTLNAIRLLPVSCTKRYSLYATYLKLFVSRRLGSQGRASFKLWGLWHLAPSSRAAEFLVKDVYIGMPYRLSLRSAKRILDVGANCGFATLFFKSHFPDASILAVEPLKREADYIREAIRLNNLAGITVINCAVGSAPGMIDLYTEEENTVVSSFSVVRSGTARHQQTEVILLSSMISEEPVDILKLDIEGAETDVLHELSRANVLSPSRIRNIVMEYHRFDPSQISMFPEILKLLESVGYAYSISAKASAGSVQQDVLVYCREKS
jgi:FkbM family methyltransferase